MKITYIHQYFVQPDTHGGTRSYEFARRLLAAGHEVTMITSTAMLPKRYQDDPRDVFTTELVGIPAVVIKVPYANEMGFADRMRAFLTFAVRSSIEAMRLPADVIFATSTPLTIAIPGIAASLRRRAPLVFEVRDLWPELPIALGMFQNPLLRWPALALEWIAYAAAKRVVALSPGMAEGVIARGKRPEHVVVIPNSCDVEQFDVPAERGEVFRTTLPGLAPDQPLVVYTGTFGLLNGAGYLVEVASAMRTINPQVRFLMMGAGAERPKVAELARRRGVLDVNLWINDPVPKAEMPAVLSAATVATSLFIQLEAMWKNSANKFFDALSAGRPVAINYGGWQADLLRNTGAGLVMSADNPQTAAQQLADLIADPQRLQHARQAARRLAYEQFNRDLMAERLEATLIEAAGRARPAEQHSPSRG